MNFDQAIEIVGIHEGAYSTDRNDRGNYTPSGVFKGTKYGISALSYPHLDIKNLTWQQAKDIYYKDFWLQNNIHLINKDLRLFTLDSVINHGSAGGIKLLQSAAGVKQDGVVGPKTIQASQKVSAWDFARVRSDYYVTITQNGFNDENDRKQLKGWLRRNLAILKQSLS